MLWQPVIFLMSWVTALSGAATDFAIQEEKHAETPSVTAASTHDPQMKSEVNLDKGKSESTAANNKAARLEGVPRLVAQLRHLQRTIHERYSLTPEKSASIDGLFDDYLAALQSEDGKGRPFGTSSGDAESLRLLQEEMNEANQRRDSETIARLKARYAEMLDSRLNKFGVSLDQFYGKVIRQLDEEQGLKLRGVIRQMRIGENRAPDHPELLRLKRAVETPRVELTYVQRRTIGAQLRVIAWDVAQAEWTNGDVAGPLARAKAAIEKELEPQQLSMFHLALAAQELEFGKRKFMTPGKLGGAGRTGTDSTERVPTGRLKNP